MRMTEKTARSARRVPLRPSRRDVQRAIREVEELWKPPKETAPALAGAEAEGDNHKYCAADYSTTPAEANAEDQVSLARQRFTIAKRRFLDVSKAAVAGQAGPGAVAAALRDVDRARAELREAELSRAAMRRARTC